MPALALGDFRRLGFASATTVGSRLGAFGLAAAFLAAGASTVAVAAFARDLRAFGVAGAGTEVRVELPVFDESGR